MTDKIFLSEHDGNMALPQGEEVLALACIEGLTHLLNARSAILVETTLELAVHVEIYLFVELVRRISVALLVQILKDSIVYVFLRGGKIIQIYSAISPTAIFRQCVLCTICTSTRSVPAVHSLKRLWILDSVSRHSARTLVSILLLVSILGSAAVHFLN